MKAVVILLSILVFITCLVFGIQAGNASIPTVDADGSHPVQTATISAIASQQTILLIGVDDLSASTPELVSLWIVLYRTDLPNVTLFPLYPTTSADASGDLPGSFGFDQNGSLSQKFLDQVNAYNFAWNGYLVIDESGISEFVDFLGGVEIGDTTLDGKNVSGIISQSSENGSESVDAQYRVGKAICTRLVSMSTDTDWQPVWTTLTSGHLRSTLNITALTSDWREITSNNSPISCEFPKP